MNWNEEYRVDTLEGIKGQDYNINKLKALVTELHKAKGDDANIPHFYFEGPHGSGKTTAAYAFLLDAFGPDYTSNFMELNASETRIDKIRTDVMDFADKSPIGEYDFNGHVYDLPFNIVFLDEIDYLPPKSQAILRRVMEKYAETTRFVLSCNYGHKVIGALKSRCMCFYFRRIKPKHIKIILKPILAIEKIEIEPEALDIIADRCKGDARAAMNILQKASIGNSKIDVAEVKRAAHTTVINFNTQILGAAIIANGNGDEDYDKDFKMLESRIDALYQDDGMSGEEIVRLIFDEVSASKDMGIKLKRKIYETILDAMYKCNIVDDDLYAVKGWLRGIRV